MLGYRDVKVGTAGGASLPSRSPYSIWKVGLWLDKAVPQIGLAFDNLFVGSVHPIKVKLST